MLAISSTAAAEDIVAYQAEGDAPASGADARTMALDEAMWARARGWALWKALITLRDDTGGIAARRFGWCLGPRAVIDELLTEP